MMIEDINNLGNFNNFPNIRDNKIFDYDMQKGVGSNVTPNNKTPNYKTPSNLNSDDVDLDQLMMEEESDNKRGD